MVEGGSILHADHPRKWVIFACRSTDEGYDCFLINQIAVDPKASPRSRHGFQDRSLFKAGQIIEIENGRRVIEVVGRLDVHEFLRDSNQVGS